MDNDVVVTPHSGQIKMLSTRKRFVLAAAGIQGGKTFGGSIWAQLEIQKYPQGNGLVTALSYDQLNNAVIDKFFNLFPAYKQYFNKKEKTLFLPTGGKVFFRSLEDPKYVEGITAHWAWIDEADLCGYKGYLVVRGRLNATGGRLLMTSSLADNSWIAENFSNFNEDEFEIITWPSNVNPAFTQEEWESLQRELDPTIFRRRYMAELSFATGRVYNLFDPLKHSPEALPKEEFIEKTMIGIDWGYVDPTAIVVVGLTNKKNVYVIEDFMVEGAPMDLIVAVLKKFKKEHDVKIFFADPQNKTFLHAVQAKAGISIQPGQRDIFLGTSLIRSLIFQNRFFVLANCKHVLKEIRQYHFKEGLIGRSEEIADKWNHCMDAMRYVRASYPIPSLKYKQEDKEEVVPYWERRTPAYQRAMQASNPYGVIQSDVFIP